MSLAYVKVMKKVIILSNTLLILSLKNLILSLLAILWSFQILCINYYNLQIGDSGNMTRRCGFKFPAFFCL